MDRGVANTEWCTLFPHASIYPLPAIGSDHNPLLLNTCIDSCGGPRPFKFEAMWISDNSCYDVVQKGWNLFCKGSSHFQLNSRIKNVKKSLKDWNFSHFGHCQSTIKSLQEQIGLLQSQPQSDVVVSQEASLQLNLDEWLKRLEIFWKQKSKVKWFKDGDANSRFFHLSTIIHARSNKIPFIVDYNNITVFYWKKIGNCFPPSMKSFLNLI